MASRVLSIEINQIVTKICEADEKTRKPKVHQSFMVNTPEGVITDGMLQPDEEYVRMLKSALTAHKVKAKRVIFSIASTKIASREVTIPYVKENKVGEVIAAKAEEYFPVDMSNYKVTYTLLGTVEDDKGSKKHKALVLAVPINLLEGYYALAESCDLEVAALDYMGNSLFQAVQNHCSQGTQMVAKIDENSTLLMIIRDGAMVSIRNVTYGVGEAIQVVMDQAQKTKNEWDNGYKDAVATLRQTVYIKRNEEENAREVGAIVSEVTDTLDYLVGGISRVIDFYNSKSEEQPIQKIHITGVGGSFQGMSELLQGQLGIPVAVIKSIEGLTVPRDFHATSLGDYIACIGATIHPLDLTLASEAKQEKGGKKEAAAARKGDNTGLALTICLGGVAVACVLAVVALVPYKKAQLENQRLNNRIEELQPVEIVHNTYLDAQTLWTDADNMYAITQNNNENLVSFIQEMEQKMPSDIIVLSMVASADNVTLNIDVNSKESAAKVLQELDAFESVRLTQTTGLTDVRDNRDMHVVSFSVTCVYEELSAKPQAQQTQDQSMQGSDDVLQETMDAVD